MNSRARQSLESAETTRHEDERTAHLSREALWRRAAERLEEASSSPPSSLSGMVAALAYDAPSEQPFYDAVRALCWRHVDGVPGRRSARGRLRKS